MRSGNSAVPGHLRAGIPLTRVSGGSHRPLPMSAHHLHHHLELNYVHTGSVSYSFLGRRRILGAGSFTAFWAAVPHRLVDSEADTWMSWFTVPLQFVGASRLTAFLTRLFQGELVHDPHPGDRDGADAARWVGDLSHGSTALRAAATLEIVARIIRLAASARTTPEDGQYEIRNAVSADVQRRLRRMLDTIHDRYADTIGLSEIAGAAALSPDYASSVFHSAIGLSPVEYLLTIRVYRACQLLVETDRAVTDIALASGFRAVSTFYDMFHKVMGIPPGEIRKSHAWWETGDD